MRNTRIQPLCIFAMLTVVTCAAHAQTFSVLYNFGSVSGDPKDTQYSGVIAQGRDGNLYSTSPGGGIGGGTVFKITPAGTVTVLYESSLTPGFGPYGGLTLGADGNFYGTNSAGGWPHDAGTIFKITPKGVLTNLYEFTEAGDGGLPYASPIQGADGNYYGTTSGTIYKITPTGTFTTLYQLSGTTYAPLIQGRDGYLYGTTENGGAFGVGSVFKMTVGGVFTVLYSFDGSLGYAPFSPLVQGVDGDFYGTTAIGGGVIFGSVFKMTPAGEITVLHKFTGGSDGCFPHSGLVQATDGNF
jgi:uncharacterized repeat protein (TIGR03803 family)